MANGQGLFDPIPFQGRPGTGGVFPLVGSGEAVGPVVPSWASFVLPMPSLVMPEGMTPPPELQTVLGTTWMQTFGGIRVAEIAAEANKFIAQQQAAAAQAAAAADSARAAAQAAMARAQEAAARYGAQAQMMSAWYAAEAQMYTALQQRYAAQAEARAAAGAGVAAALAQWAAAVGEVELGREQLRWWAILERQRLRAESLLGPYQAHTERIAALAPVVNDLIQSPLIHYFTARGLPVPQEIVNVLTEFVGLMREVPQIPFEVPEVDLSQVRVPEIAPIISQVMEQAAPAPPPTPGPNEPQFPMLPLPPALDGGQSGGGGLNVQPGGGLSGGGGWGTDWWDTGWGW